MHTKNLEKDVYEIPPRVMIGAPHGRSGKTVISIGLCAMFKKAGLTVQAFKKGPDYIDASWLSAASGRACRNLDAFLMPRELLVKNFEKASKDADIVCVEGNMGLYDGIDRDGGGSSADVARLLRTPVILVVDTARMTRSVAALIWGYRSFEPKTRVAGVILNNVSGVRHKTKLIDAVEDYCELPVLGAVPRDAVLHISERHLGLVPFMESTSGASTIEWILDVIERHIDLEGVLAIARSAQKYATRVETRIFPSPREGAMSGPSESASSVRIGVMRDRVFHFYYPENLEALESSGAELVFIDSLRDHRLPEIGGLYIGGGFPELHLEALQANKDLMRDVASAIEDGLPVYAECAGLMYLCQGIRLEENLYEMAGVFPFQVEVCKRPQGHGYVEVEVVHENPFYPVNTALRGHEFHHSKLYAIDGLRCAFRVKRGYGINGTSDGIVYKNTFASYAHVHALGTPSWAKAFVSLASQRQRHYEGELVLSVNLQRR